MWSLVEAETSWSPSLKKNERIKIPDQNNWKCLQFATLKARQANVAAIAFAIEGFEREDKPTNYVI